MIQVKDSVNNMTELADRIKALETKESMQIEALKLQVHETIESFRPANLVKSALSDIASSKTIKQDALNAAVGVGAGMLIKKIITYKSKSLFRKMAGYALQLITTKVVSDKLPDLRQKVKDLS